MTRRITTGRIDECREVVVVRVRFLRGHGTEDDPARIVTAYYTRGGALICEHDAIAGRDPMADLLDGSAGQETPK